MSKNKKTTEKTEKEIEIDGNIIGHMKLDILCAYCNKSSETMYRGTLLCKKCLLQEIQKLHMQNSL